jgi:hypothetical protein
MKSVLTDKGDACRRAGITGRDFHGLTDLAILTGARRNAVPD